MLPDPVELTKQIKAASDIVAVVGAYLSLHPAGKTYKALCPFHNDTRPSMDVDPARQRYKCWSCGASGDVFAFVQHAEKVGFREARQILAARAGIKLDEQQSPQDQARTRLLGVMRWAVEQYQRCLLDDPLGEPARKYLGGRKLSGKTVRDFGLGYAPLAGDWLVRRAAADQVPTDVLIEVGLILNRDGGRGFFDRFRDRVMFPIRDVQARPVAFGGRILPESPYATRAPKYYNSAETPLFSKSDVLYGLDLARHAGAAAGFLAVVEGYTDVMMAHQCGVPPVVATMGTALTARHVAQLRRYAPKVVLVYDADAGGTTGVDRALELSVSNDVELAVATLPDHLDPCDLLVRPDGPETFKKVLAGATDALDFAFARLLGQEDVPSVETARAVHDRILRVMATSNMVQGRGEYKTSLRVKQELILTRLAQRLRIGFDTVRKRFAELVREHEAKQAVKAAPAGVAGPAPRVQASAARTSQPPAPKVTAAVRAELELVELLLAHPRFVAEAVAAVSPAEFTHPDARRVLEELYAIHAAGLVPDMERLRDRLADRPDLYDRAEQRRFIGEQVKEPEHNLALRLRWFAEQRLAAEERGLMDRIRAGGLGPEEVAEVREKLKSLQDRKRKLAG
ncbi:MAG: DNA primase [Gemmataceae bacterium]|nr:DNA primase [Gemmataceae bacterium]